MRFKTRRYRTLRRSRYPRSDMSEAARELSFKRFVMRRVWQRLPVKAQTRRPFSSVMQRALFRAGNVAMGLPPECPF